MMVVHCIFHGNNHTVTASVLTANTAAFGPGQLVAAEEQPGFYKMCSQPIQPLLVLQDIFLILL